MMVPSLASGGMLNKSTTFKSLLPGAAGTTIKEEPDNGDATSSAEQDQEGAASQS